MALGVIPGFKFLSLILVVCIFAQKLANGQYQNLSAEQEIEFSREFRLHNKPAVKIIKTIHGERYSCVDFYQQPAFDHPLLKNHSYNYDQMNLSSFRDDQLPYQNVSSESMLLESLWANGEGCPPGTVPIRKYTKREFIRSKLFQQHISPTDTHSISPLHFRAVVHTIIGTRNKYYGASGSISVYNLHVNDHQYTAGYLAIRGGDDSFQVGWMVNPFLYNDRESRIFLITKTKKASCYNTGCPGFVIISGDIPLGAILKPYSRRGTSKDNFNFAIVRNPATKQWQLQLGDEGKVIGFWPNKILKGLSRPADYAEWGGETYSRNGGGPGMGSGFFPIGNINYDGYVHHLSIYNKEGFIAGVATETFSKDNNLYRVLDRGYVHAELGHLASFGGAGRNVLSNTCNGCPINSSKTAINE